MLNKVQEQTFFLSQRAIARYGTTPRTCEVVLQVSPVHLSFLYPSSYLLRIAVLCASLSRQTGRGTSVGTWTSIVRFFHLAYQSNFHVKIEANVPVIISHVASNKNLSVEPSFWFPTYFGVECEVSVHTYLNVYRCETENNIWAFITNLPNN